MEEYLCKKVKVVMDRSLGSKHHNHGFVYPINYGYIPSIVSGDGEEIDVYIIGEFEPLESYEGYVIAIIGSGGCVALPKPKPLCKCKICT
ncbi:hypothetical protein psyc5s11_23340 [Clostridium gelidum]|uniref:inorganic diphosphatase n=1 Tax=Clostridium gelidum TaxID=704125 RepID=A0ABN6IVS4_9CLOT|nr:inorganic diphosphatase [Clostridium gelidum]BCZ46267.1 hypothetical protein psyc5s11_23340 [Clostridium gelidum]